VKVRPKLLVEDTNSVERERELDFSFRAVRAEVEGLHGGIVTLEFEDQRLWISGGPSAFTVTVSFGDNERIYDLVGEGDASGEMELIIGNQRMEWPRRLVVDIETCLAVAEQFATGQLVDFSRWREQ